MLPACLRPSESGNRDKDGETDNQMIWRLKYKLCRKQSAKNLEVEKGGILNDDSLLVVPGTGIEPVRPY